MGEESVEHRLPTSFVPEERTSREGRRVVINLTDSGNNDDMTLSRGRRRVRTKEIRKCLLQGLL